jgi:hypothetical protein
VLSEGVTLTLTLIECDAVVVVELYQVDFFQKVLVVGREQLTPSLSHIPEGSTKHILFMALTTHYSRTSTQSDDVSIWRLIYNLVVS